MKMTIDIGVTPGFPSTSLSNFHAHSFIIDGVLCGSMEGFLQGLKFEDVERQINVCARIGIKAKNKGRKRNGIWKEAQTLWWQGVAFKRDSKEFQRLLDRAFNALSKNSDFQLALLVTGNAKLIHSMGKEDPKDTVLTEKEFCSRLRKIRTRLLKGK